MKQVDWNNYFYSHYKPLEATWSEKDLAKYKKWYQGWIDYIESLGLTFKNKKILELGCGIGAVSSLLSERNADVTGSDIANIMIKFAHQYSPHIPFVSYDITKPFLSKKKFDYVVAFEVLEHIDNTQIALKNIYNLLVKDGYFIGTTPYPYKKNMIDPTHVNVNLPTFWEGVFKKGGFTSVKTYPMSFLPFLWKISNGNNPVLPFYISHRWFVSTCLIIAKK